MLTAREKAWLLIPKALPSSTHYLNLRAVMPKKEWASLRITALNKANNCCELCGVASPKLQLHEMWEFDFVKKQQILTRLVVLCLHCHRLQHMMLLKLQVDQGRASVYQTLKKYQELTNRKITAQELFRLAAAEASKYEGIDWDLVIKL